MALIPVTTALARVLEGIPPPDEETVPVGDADRRVLTQDLVARFTQPPFASSAMDGYAIHGEEDAPIGAGWRVVGESAAGRGYSGSVGVGEAVRIFTGAPVPAACGTVVIQEDVTRDGDRITAIDATEAGANIRPAGGDFSAGDVLLAAGRVLDPHAMTLAAGMGYGEVPVARRPVVAILATGSELVPPGTAPGEDQIVSSNPVGLAALVARAGGVPRLLGIAPDSIDAIVAHVRAAKGADILVTIGGASVGDHDLVGTALEREGLDLAFWKVAIRPGKPLMFGRLGPMRVLGLPGNPVSALITARTFLVPLIEAMTGLPRRPRGPEMAVLTRPLDGNGPRLHLMRAKLGKRGDGLLTVTPMGSQDSSLLLTLVEADCLILRAPNAPPAAAGDLVEVDRLGD